MNASSLSLSLSEFPYFRSGQTAETRGLGGNGTKLSRFSSIFSAKIEEKDCTRADFMEAFEYENITTFPTRF